MTVGAHKRYANGNGVETEAPLNEMIDVGVFSADPASDAFSQANVISLQPQRIRTGACKITMVLNQQPKFVGLDPYLKYIDRDVDDNIRSVTVK